jgi:SH3-like domain-containing protein
MAAGDIAPGKVSGLPVPRYVSLKTDRVNMREGPSKDHRTAWVFQRAGLPVEIVAEHEVWRRIRDAEGTEGWVLHSLLSGRRTALVMPWAKREASPLPLTEKPEERSDVVARLEPHVVTSVKKCQDGWCRVVIVRPGRDLSGFIRQDRLWGVYPNEKLD